MVAEKAKTMSLKEMQKFLSRFALNIGEFDLEYAMKNVHEIYEKSSKEDGEFFKILLRLCNREIDWMLCRELENNFLGK